MAYFDGFDMTGRTLFKLYEWNLESLEAIGFAVQHFSEYTGSNDIVAHGHDVLEANFIVNGVARHCIEGTERLCSSGSMGIVHYDQKHTLVTDDEPVEVINLYLDPARHRFPELPPELSVMAESLFPATTNPGTPRGLVSFLQFQDPDPMTALLRHCAQEQTEKGVGYLSSMESALRMILIACARQAMLEGVETMMSDSSASVDLEPVRQLLEQEYTTSHTLTDLARQACMSPAHFCRRFKAYTGLSPIEYLAQRRIRAAM
jgi:AraC-like DNA-binding protein